MSSKVFIFKGSLKCFILWSRQGIPPRSNVFVWGETRKVPLFVFSNLILRFSVLDTFFFASRNGSPFQVIILFSCFFFSLKPMPPSPHYGKCSWQHPCTPGRPLDTNADLFGLMVLLPWFRPMVVSVLRLPPYMELLTGHLTPENSSLRGFLIGGKGVIMLFPKCTKHRF